LTAGLALAGCATQFENFPLAASQTNVERREVDVSQEDRPLILVAMSGGGVRASALAWMVLEQLKDSTYTNGGTVHNLADDVAVVSSASGGSVTAAYFALNGSSGLDAFESKFLTRNNMGALTLEAANPLAWLSLAFSGQGRTDKVRNLFDARLFDGRTLGELNRPGKPYVALNATDMASGEVFSFTPQRFNDIESDFDREPISVAVASSSAVPIVLSPIAFRNYSEPKCPCPQDAMAPSTKCPSSQMEMPPRICSELFDKRFAAFANIEQFKRTRYEYDLRKGYGGFRTIDYLYFVDGGLADNLGIHALLEAISSPYGPQIIGVNSAKPGQKATIIDAINQGKIRRLAVIVVNSRSDPVNGIYQSSSRPGVLKMINSVASNPIDSNTAGVNAQMEVLMAALRGAAGGGAGDPLSRGMHVYDIEIDFDLLRADDSEQRKLRDQAKSIPTSWTISADDLRVLKSAGQVLLQQNPCYQRLLLDSGVSRDFVDQSYAMKGCRQANDPSAAQ
jgi:NTE family protein